MDALRQSLNTRSGQTIAAVIDAILVYIFASIAIDTASMFAYAAAIFFFFSTMYHIVQIAKLSKPAPMKKKAAK